MIANVLAVGAPPLFRDQVADALSASPQPVEWLASAADLSSFFERAQPPAVLVISPEISDHEALSLAESVGRRSPSTAMVLVRGHELNGLLPEVMRAGVRDVVDLSRGDDLTAALERALTWSSSLRSLHVEERKQGPDHRGRIVSIFSSKGGTGKTFVASNFAAAIAARLQQDVALVDLDLGMGDVLSYYGREPTRPLADLIALGDGVDRATIMATGTRLGEHLLGFGSVSDPAAERIRGEAITNLLHALQASFKFVVVDLGPDYSDHSLAAFDASDEILLVTGLDVVGIKHLSKALDTLLSIGLPRERFRIVLNRADSNVGLEARDLERVLKVEVDASIPSSRLVPMALNMGTPVYLSEPKSDVAKSIGALADGFVGAQASKGVSSDKRRLFRRR
ncbi:MAG: CpaE family protein [Actinomycetota bacterium]